MLMLKAKTIELLNTYTRLEMRQSRNACTLELTVVT